MEQSLYFFIIIIKNFFLELSLFQALRQWESNRENIFLLFCLLLSWSLERTTLSLKLELDYEKSPSSAQG